MKATPWEYMAEWMHHDIVTLRCNQLGSIGWQVVTMEHTASEASAQTVSYGGQTITVKPGFSDGWWVFLQRTPIGG